MKNTTKKFVPYEKLSKKEQKKLNDARRSTWGDLNPVSKASPTGQVNKARADKKRARQEMREYV